MPLREKPTSPIVMKAQYRKTRWYQIASEVKAALINLAFRVPCGAFRSWLFRRLAGSCIGYPAIARGVVFKKIGSVHTRGNIVINANCIIDGRGGRIEVGSNVDIGQDCHLWTLEHDKDSVDHRTKGGPIVIGDYVWIATRVTILPNKTIGFGAVIAAGAVITKSVQSMQVMGGNPARAISARMAPPEYELIYKFLF